MTRVIIPMAALDYLKTRKKLWLKALTALIPSLAAGLVLNFATPNSAIALSDVFTDFVNIQISAVAILISFSMAIITILVSADNANISRLKERHSTDCNPLNGVPISLFQVLLSNISYNILVEVLYLGILISLVFGRMYVSEGVCKILMALCVFFIVHILHILLETVEQMYLTFWKHEGKET